MKITAITLQVRDNDRVNISVDGRYKFSLAVYQVTELGLKLNQELDEETLKTLENESQFGKLYARSLEYSMVRPRSTKEVRDYLWRKTQTTKYKSKKTGEILERSGVSPNTADRVLEKLLSRGYIDDEKFTKYWIENRFLKKGTSTRRLKQELSQKGIDREIISKALGESSRNDIDELQKVIAKKRARYPDEQKFKQYLARQGFNFDDINRVLETTD
ncbi:hypothetical protein EOM60_02265 [Candidatus Saccharibacteria bacterium]|nr:hypothetical protein [Candidatus Saccharibacteria bacterium]